MNRAAGGGIGADEAPYSYDGEEFRNPRILVVGCGEAGSRMVRRLEKVGSSGADLLEVWDSHRRRGPGGGGGSAEGVGPRTDEGKADLEEALQGADLVFVLGGLGEGMKPEGAAPAVCEIAGELGRTTVAIFTLRPESREDEEGRRPGGALMGELAEEADTVLLLDGGRVLEVAPDLSAEEASSVMDQVVAEILRGIVETVQETSLINLDYAGLKNVVGSGGLASALVGESGCEDGPEAAVRSALRNPMLEADLQRAKGCILTITGGRDLTLHEAAAIASAMRRDLAPGAELVWGARLKEGHEGKVGLLATIVGVELPTDIRESGTARGVMAARRD